MDGQVVRSWIGSAVVLATAGTAVLGLESVGPAQDHLPGVERVIAAFEAASARETREVASFTTTKTFTIEHAGKTSAQTVADLRFTAPDVKAFAVKAILGSDFLRGRVIDKMMAAEIEAAQRSRRVSVAISAANYEFVGVQEDGDAFVIEVLPRRRDELLFKGRIWVTKDGFHLERIEGEPAKAPSFWTPRIHFVSEYAPVGGVWLHVRTVARVNVRVFGEYVVRSECGPYEMVLLPPLAAARF